MVEITFAITGLEYFEGLLVSSLKRIFPRTGFLVFPLIMLLGLFGVLRISDDPLSLLAYALAAAAGLFLLLSIVPALRAIQYSRSRRMSAEATWRIRPDRIEIRTKSGKAQRNWKSFGRMTETWHLFLLHSAAETQTIFILPKRAFRDRAQVVRFKEMARRGCGEADHRRSTIDGRR
jgi:hypothetical protein